jgi:Fe-S-cluster-containing hydrogenase component 2
VSRECQNDREEPIGQKAKLLDYPLQSLNRGTWVKLICGASFQDLPAIRSLAIAYTLAGVDCIDVAGDPAVVATAVEGLKVARNLAQRAAARGFPGGNRSPWLMVSLNDGEDPHFRKAEFDPARCPPDCPRPCQSICPTQAIAFANGGFSGVREQRCYGCGRCLPACPSQLILTRSHTASPQVIAPLVAGGTVAALEIHTQPGRQREFQRLWQEIAPWSHYLKVLAISCPDAQDTVSYLQSLYDHISPLPCPLIWQADGRPMSGDLGRGTTHAALKLAKKLIQAGLPGYVQLAGGTNDHTATKLRSLELLPGTGTRISFPAAVAGIAYGSYARCLLSPVLEILERAGGEICPRSPNRPRYLEEAPDLLWQAVTLARGLVSQMKG